MVEKEVHITTITAPTVPLWAVFTSEEGEPEIWTERVHLWAQTKTGLSQDDKAAEAFLDHEVPPDKIEVQAMVLDEGSLVLVGESQFVFMGYSSTEQVETSQWAESVKYARQRFRRRFEEE